MKHSTNPFRKNPLFLRNCIGIGAGYFGATLIGGMVSSFFSFYLTDVMYLPAHMVGIIIGVSAVIDGVTDFIMGVIEDNTSSRWGKARGWVLFFAAPLALSMFLLFCVPASVSLTGKIVYVIIIYTLYCLAYTIVHLPLITLNALTSADSSERALLSTISMFFSMGTGMVVSNLLVPLVTAFGGGSDGYRNTALLFSLFGLICLFLSVGLTREIPVPVSGEKFSIRELFIQLKALFSNKYWWLMNLCAVFNSFGFMIINNIQTYYCRYVVGDLSRIGILFSCATLSQMVAMPLAAPLIVRFGKKKTAICGGLLSLLGYAVILADTSSFLLLCVGNVIRGVFFAPVNACETAFFADTVEYGEWKTGFRQEGLVFSVKSTLNKMVGSLITAGLGLALSLSGYAGELAVQPDSAVATIKYLFIFGPIIAYTLCVISLCFFRLDKKMPAIRAELEKRHRNSQENRECTPQQ